MQTIDIKVNLLRKGVSMRSIAKKLGVSHNAVALVVKHKLMSRRIMEAVAAALDLDVLTVFPELQEKQGRRSCSKS
ncbi:MAG: helix-turn-helix domain-containing protein [Candidatus Cloacimonadaceae bacterium]|jgi:lambda repressor-like predicted transcriptional regulator